MAYYYLSGSNWCNSCGNKKNTSCCDKNKQQEWLLNSNSSALSNNVMMAMVGAKHQFTVAMMSAEILHFQ